MHDERRGTCGMRARCLVELERTESWQRQKLDLAEKKNTMNDEKSGLILILCASLQLLGQKSTSFYPIWMPKSF